MLLDSNSFTTFYAPPRTRFCAMPLPKGERFAPPNLRRSFRNADRRSAAVPYRGRACR
jgi:hypothetical protein